ncbi:histidine phosphatase family protein [Chitiniphilus purpureus]|uniref:Histidine phosphatase family protein n=1 Tax=Chitiniphilus purpureus TaxID=2981137 RepID=A0ABY6DNK8_9NEIS|nr:histidine phosphatase family protein [Chitiniphilus sp. CD1]UXY15972.1 histidine phosphatase family protein [Chitiniphilus sp. CD1]
MSAFRLSLLRHGETEESATRLLGQYDAALTPEGWRQLHLRWRGIERYEVTALASSDLIRCAAFARERTATLGVPLTVHAGWRECHFGVLDGRLRDSLSAEEAGALHEWQRAPEYASLPGGETWHGFQARVQRTTEQWLIDSEGGHRVLLTHGGVIRALLVGWLGMPANRHAQFWINHAACVSLWWDDGYPPILLGIDNTLPTLAGP